MEIHLTQHLPRGICNWHRPGLAAPGKRSPCSCNIHSQISWAPSWQYVFHLVPLEHGDIPSGSELFLHIFPVFRVSRVCQIFFLEFSKDCSTDLGDEFTDGGLANQPVILQGCVCFSCCQVSHRYCQFQSNS